MNVNNHQWIFQPTQKYSLRGVERGVLPRQTVRRITPIMPLIGVTGTRAITYLDRPSIPTFVTVRPQDAAPGISYYSGKGSTAIEAKAGAMMEAIERYSAETCNLPVRYCTYEEILRHGSAVNPQDFAIPRTQEFTSELAIEWVEGYDFINQELVYVPLNTVLFPYRPQKAAAPFYSSTNGLAAGNNMEEAVCHAICEVIERDALSQVRTSLWLIPRIDEILRSVGYVRSRDQESIGNKFPLISLKKLPTRSARLIGKLQRAGLRVYLRDITGDLGIPTIECTILDDRRGNGAVAHGGCGTHPDSRVALLRAITEAAQSRLVHIQGAREDLPEISKPRRSFDYENYFAGIKLVPFGRVRSYEHDRVDEDIYFLLNQLKACTLDRIIAIDLTRPEIGIPVVRVIIPSCETWGMFRLHTSRGQLGRRASLIMEQSRG